MGTLTEKSYDIKGKPKKMFIHLTKAGPDFQDPMFDYKSDFIFNKTVSDTSDYTELFGPSKGKRIKLDLNMMRYIHGKGWDTKLFDALVSERIKPFIIANCPKMQIIGIKDNSSENAH